MSEKGGFRVVLLRVLPGQQHLDQTNTCLCDKQLQNESLNRSLALRWVLLHVSMPLSPRSWCMCVCCPSLKAMKKKQLKRNATALTWLFLGPWGILYLFGG